MKQHGFTLVELLVAIAVFSILVSIGMGGFVHALHTQREVSNLISVQSNASIAIEQMAREIRTGYLFCTTSGGGNNNTAPAAPSPICQWNGLTKTGCTVSGSVWTCNNILDFNNASYQNVDYQLVKGALQRSTTGSGGYTAITGDTSHISYLTFTIFGNTEGDHWPPRITISMGVAPSSSDPAVSGDIINLQTTVSARQVDCTQGTPIAC